jgi:excisionase family DNA binding protein
MPQFLTVAEAAVALRVEQQTITAWLRSGRLPGAKIGKLWFVPVSALERLEASAFTTKPAFLTGMVVK